MKKIKYILLVAVALLLSNCDTNDDGFYSTVYVNVPHLVSIAPHTSNYTVGEKLYVTADFSRYQDENGKLLDLYKTTGATAFTFSYVIEKQVAAATWETVFVNNNLLDVVKGQAENGSFVNGICVYNSTDETYEYNVGFPLLSAGTYRLSYGYNSDSTTEVEIRSLSPAKRLTIKINSLLAGIDSEGYYNFTVN
ncbi:hypothetical protein EZL74_08700 [Flavobacterium silvisoli]|uniref:DUF5017 domain-containing protein n=1 Tax=Flavobacterium silvisoli TaxID=2529433 RepID=A0A4Q9YX43_9FLAO|nr:hypothetical protein [Flavobacterium silvisoli]TBX68380.1 hypothetical protein EZL74_08700 [Flavobacterium silvisoli]